MEMNNQQNKKVKLFRLEHRKEQILPRHKFITRIITYALWAAVILLVSLGIGILGYHDLESMTWTDSFLNAAMILGGMGPVNALYTHAGKIFAGLYALFSGVIFLLVVGIMFTPLVHRFMHRFHFGDGDSVNRNS